MLSLLFSYFVTADHRVILGHYAMKIKFSVYWDILLYSCIQRTYLEFKPLIRCNYLKYPTVQVIKQSQIYIQSMLKVVCHYFLGWKNNKCV